MTSLTLRAPAKVNLILKVLGKRKDGYHELSTLFERIALFDTITISKIPNGIEVLSSRPITKDPKDNIMYKAAELMIAGGRIKSGVRIRIVKRIPMAGGLGGGSSDAAGVILGMNRLFHLGLGVRRLMSLGGKLGADVPFFIMDTPYATGRGRGDVLKKVDIGIKLWNLIIYPGPLKASTKDIYSYLDIYNKRVEGLTRSTADDKITLPLRQAVDVGSIQSMLCNDLEDAVISKKKVIGGILRRLAYSLGSKLIVSGSGPSIFCLYSTRREAFGASRRLISGIPAGVRKGWQVFVAETFL